MGSYKALGWASFGPNLVNRMWCGAIVKWNLHNNIVIIGVLIQTSIVGF